MIALQSEYEEAKSLEARIARDADLLECLIQAREYQAMGCYNVSDWISNARAALLTDSAKKMAQECLETDPGVWFDDETDEWVILLRGSAGLLLEGESKEAIMGPGDYILIPAHKRHRVEW